MIHAEDFNSVQNKPLERVGWPLIWIWKRIGITNNRTKLSVNRSPKDAITQQRKVLIRKNIKQKPITKPWRCRNPAENRSWQQITV
jgi:hypothetical protein